MQRGKPLRRKTPIQAKTQIRSMTPLKSIGEALRRTPLKQISVKRQRENRERRAVVTAMYEAQPWCARCGQTDVPLAGHEKLGRAQGGDPTKPDVLLCSVCNTWCEDNPIEAAAAGWKISRKHGRRSE